MPVNNFNFGFNFNVKDNATSKLAKVKSLLTGVKAKGIQTTQTFASGTIKIRNFSRNLRQMGVTGYQDTVKVSKGAEILKTSLKQLGTTGTQATSAVADGFFKIGIVSQGLMHAKRALRGLLSTTDDYAKFETAMGEVSTLVDTSIVDMDSLGKQVLDLSATYGAFPVDTAKALYTTISAGFTDVADANTILHASNKLAIGGVTDVNNALDGLTSTLNAWGLSSKESTNVSDAMFVAMKAGKLTVGELSANIGNVSAIASQAGVSYRELLSAT
ncbi:MAG: phage tail tape measure protein, partial [Bacteroidetes bacterium]